MCSCVVFQILHSLGLGAGGSRRLSLPFLQEGCHQRVQGETLSVLNMTKIKTVLHPRTQILTLNNCVI